MKIKFLGAAGTVTGSKYLITTKDRNYLVDCGLFQGLKDLRKRNWRSLDIEPAEISAVFLTHAHVDHSGYLPRLVAMGFSGPVYCSKGTFDLAKILLPDSGYLQEEEARYANAKGYSKHKPALPLYTRDQAEESLNFFQAVDFQKSFKVFNDLEVSFTRAGHILGASCISLKAQGKRIIFSGDVGRYQDPIMFPPEPLPDADYLVIESTYGDRLHEDVDLMGRMAEVINDAASKNGAIVIPAFAVGRAQLILHIIRKLKDQKKIPDIKTYLDSPMAINATELYCEYHDEHRLTEEESFEMCDVAALTRTTEQSKAINDKPGLKIIISASGMISGGRILHHVAHYITDERNTIVLVGYQAVGTRGRDLQEGVTQIKIFGENYNVRAKIESISSLSAHGDYNDLIHWLNESKIDHPKVFVTHGEPDAALAFSKRLIDTFKWDVEVPKDGAEYDL
jgi:metallo-beta-lactamase family protein